MFLACEPLADWGHVAVAEPLTRQDFTRQMRWLVGEAYPETEKASVLPSVSTRSPRRRPTSLALRQAGAPVLEAPAGEVPPAGDVGAPGVEGPTVVLGPGVGQDGDVGRCSRRSLRRRRKERQRSSGNGVRFSSGYHGPTNGGDHEINLAKGPLCCWA